MRCCRRDLCGGLSSAQEIVELRSENRCAVRLIKALRGALPVREGTATADRKLVARFPASWLWVRHDSIPVLILPAWALPGCFESDAASFT